MKISVVISAYNASSKIEETLKALKGFADEIVVVNSSSTDDTEIITKRFTSKVFTQPNYPMLNKNKNYGFSKATGDWILNLDHDEVLTDELKKEIQQKIKHTEVVGFYIPRKNIIFGKWIQHTGWYPDFQLRLFRRGEGKFAEKHVHELLTVNGQTDNLTNPLTHYNYETVSQFLEKMVRIYTVSEAENLIKEGYSFSYTDSLKMPIEEFFRRYFLQKGYKDGMHGLVLSLLMGVYHFVVWARVWEQKKFPQSEDSLSVLSEGVLFAGREYKHWKTEVRKEKAKSPLKKQFIRLHSKISR